jgi:hypothetical protein
LTTLVTTRRAKTPIATPTMEIEVMKDKKFPRLFESRNRRAISMESFKREFDTDPSFARF